MTIPFLSIFSSKHKSGSSMKDYESAVKQPSRPQPATQAKDSTESLSEITHEKLVALSRHAMRNFGIVKEACQSKALYAIGDGLKPQPRSEDPEWNRKAAAIFERVFDDLFATLSAATLNDTEIAGDAPIEFYSIEPESVNTPEYDEFRIVQRATFKAFVQF